MSSVAYAPQEMLIVLAAAGMGAFGYSIPLAIAICVLLLLLILSYEQTIHTYPDGGGAYIVARDNLGETAALTAGSALLMDYILTVAVSISSSVAQIGFCISSHLRIPGMDCRWHGNFHHAYQPEGCQGSRDNVCNSNPFFLLMTF